MRMARVLFRLDSVVDVIVATAEGGVLPVVQDSGPENAQNQVQSNREQLPSTETRETGYSCSR